MPASKEVREKAVKAYKEGGVTYESLGERFKVDKNTIRNWVYDDRAKTKKAPTIAAEPVTARAENYYRVAASLARENAKLRGLLVDTLLGRAE